MSDFQNPQEDPGSQKRLLLSFLLTFLVIALMQPLLTRYTRQSTPARAPQPAAPAPPAKPAEAAAQPTKPPAPTILATRQATSEQETVIENDLYRITFTNRGAQVKSWILKKYTNERREPLELVNVVAAPQHGYPLSLWTYDAALRSQLNSALYIASASGQQRAPASLTFEYEDQGLVVRKHFRFDHSYVVTVETSVEAGGGAVQAYPAWPAGFGDQTVLASYAAARIEYQFADKIERLEPKKVSGGNTIRGPFHWAGAVDQYFAAVFLPEEPENAVLVTLHDSVQIPKNLDKPDPSEMEQVSVLGAAVGSVTGLTRDRVFVGPKALDVLESVHASLTGDERAALGAGGEGGHHGPDLSGLVDFGTWFGFIAKPLFMWLKWTHDHWVSNWGWAIVILTVIINLAMFPLKWSTMKSSLKMQKVQPQIKAIQEKYKKYKLSDPRRGDMNKEVSEVYKRESVNPVGGCIPMLLQMPFLFAFYTMLGVAIELRHAPWLWVRDLSAPDPYHILPIGIMISMFLLQKMTPTGGMDPMQQKMMSIAMPIMIGAISWSLSAGLGVYWMLGNIIAIVQQVIVNRTAFGREMREHMEKQARKRHAK